MKKAIVIIMAVLFIGGATLAGDQAENPAKSKEKAKIEKEYKKRQADNPEIEIVTDFGKMKLELFRDIAPIHVDSMLARIRAGFYDSLTFHRIISGFMIQGGDPRGNGTGNAGYFLPAEFSDLPHEIGTLSMARGPDVNSASCQFFICLDRQKYLDGKYTVFGHLMNGYETLNAIAAVETAGREKSSPVQTVYIRKMNILKDVAGKKTGKE